MAIILKGKLKGQTVTIRQFCNDWFSIDIKGKPLVVRATNVELNDEEKDMVLQGLYTNNIGIMFGIYDLEYFKETGKFKKKPLTKSI